MPTFAIVAEGPDDLAAIRELLRRAGGDVGGTIHEANRSPLKAKLRGQDVHVWAARGKKAELPQRTIDAAEGTAGTRPDVVAVCFDPDASPRDTEFEFFGPKFEEVRHERAGPLSVGPNPSFQISGRTVRIVPAPWRLEPMPTFAFLPHEANLERVLITGVLRSAIADSLTDWASQATSSLVGLASKHGWKRAFRIWNAALAPTSEAFVDALLQHDDVRATCLATLQESEAWKAINAMLE